MRTFRGVDRFIGNKASQATCRRRQLRPVSGKRRSENQLAAETRSETLRHQLRMYVRTPRLRQLSRVFCNPGYNEGPTEDPRMGVFDFIKGELLEVIEWTDDSRDTLSFRYPDDDKAIKNGAQLIVRESQLVQFVSLGALTDVQVPVSADIDWKQFAWVPQLVRTR